MPRLSTDVVQQLLDEMNRLVTVYPEKVERTGNTVAELIRGTACFPGGTGLWRGDNYGGPLPVTFPEGCVMFLGHNFDSISAHDTAIENRGEVKTTFWNNLKSILRKSDLDPASCFFTNALMGLKPDGASGPMPKGCAYREQCQLFLLRQIEIVAPSAIVTLGGDAKTQLRQAYKRNKTRQEIKYVGVMHPSTRPRNQLPNHSDWVYAQGRAIKNLM